ncbi:PIG-L family deacetylase [Stakelama sp. CBK3Z-3]|uniref:PIG-L family deacetylase n=1 Tax=Stakelama flava TaxID=2860338 RepID=A0ABS6XPR4_9SPHN|nr:PIG-L family deacetylase [Stakelama flava]MBW4332214.1 PIG-L family deacetylase [Stakelama flava]
MAAALQASRWRHARWFVVVPHPDDETLGAGALIAHSASKGLLAGIAFLTDGTGSHPVGTPRLAVIRRGEARAALRRLGAAHAQVDWLNWRDAHPHAPGSAAFESEARHLAQQLRRRRVEAIAVSDASDSHCDHVAAFALAAQAVRRARRHIALFSYHVWSPPHPRRRYLRTPPMASGRRRQALCAHRSQLTPRLGDGFRLPRDRLAMPPHDLLGLYEMRR